MTGAPPPENPAAEDPAAGDPRTARARAAADYIPDGARVLDLSPASGIEAWLPVGATCIAAGRFDPDTGPWPAAEAADLVLALGLLEYRADPAACLARLGRLGRPVLLGYCPVDLGGPADRAALGWKNALALAELAALARAAGFDVRRADRIGAFQALLLLDPRPRARTAPKRVLVLSYNNVGNFGDRLGYHLLASALPPHAEITWAHFHPWDVPDEPFDLVVLGIGNSLFAPLLTDRLIALLDRVPRRVGIFGTQYREAIPRARLDAVLDRLDIWHARHETDMALYGRGRADVRHLGDWLIHACPMARGTDARTLKIGDEIWKDLPLDRTIQRIQAYRRVFSTRLHPLLCALTSAEAVAYVEQRPAAGAAPSGKFRSMLLDVFGRTFPEDVMWPVDRAAVAAYKAHVAAGVERVRADLAELLG